MCMTNKKYLFIFCVLFLLKGLPPLLKLDFGLCARVFSAVLPYPEPTIDFSDCSAVSHSKSRDFRFHEPTIDFSDCSAVSHSKSRDFRFHEPTILFSYWSAVSPSKPRDFRLDEPAIPFFLLVSGFPLLKPRDFRFRL